MLRLDVRSAAGERGTSARYCTGSPIATPMRLQLYDHTRARVFGLVTRVVRTRVTAKRPHKRFTSRCDRSFNFNRRRDRQWHGCRRCTSSVQSTGFALNKLRPSGIRDTAH